MERVIEGNITEDFIQQLNNNPAMQRKFNPLTTAMLVDNVPGGGGEQASTQLSKPKPTRSLNGSIQQKNHSSKICEVL